MLEKYWKPHFDNWTEKTGTFMEKILQKPEVLRNISSTLGLVFRGKIAIDRGLHLIRASLGSPTYKDQKKMLHLLLRLGAQVEDLNDKWEEDRALTPPKESDHSGKDDETVEILQTQISDLNAKMEVMAETQALLLEKLAEMAKEKVTDAALRELVLQTQKELVKQSPIENEEADHKAE